MPKPPWNHSLHYYPKLLAAMPANCRRALDIGCGDGSLTRLLARRCPAVTGIDLDATPTSGNPTLLRGNILTHPFAPASFDFITTVATLHHLPLRPALARFRALLAPGGTLALLGLYLPATLADHALAAAAWPVSRALRLTRKYTSMLSAQQPPTTTLADIRQAARAELPGATLHRRLLHRYTLLWTRPVSASAPVKGLRQK